MSFIHKFNAVSVIHHYHVQTDKSPVGFLNFIFNFHIMPSQFVMFYETASHAIFYASAKFYYMGGQ